jgi:hypothetical protein
MNKEFDKWFKEYWGDTPPNENAILFSYNDVKEVWSACRESLKGRDEVFVDCPNCKKRVLLLDDGYCNECEINLYGEVIYNRWGHKIGVVE